ncbi:unnamed protein product [Closterium sp. NIES-54]
MRHLIAPTLNAEVNEFRLFGRTIQKPTANDLASEQFVPSGAPSTGSSSPSDARHDNAAPSDSDAENIATLPSLASAATGRTTTVHHDGDQLTPDFPAATKSHHPSKRPTQLPPSAPPLPPAMSPPQAPAPVPAALACPRCSSRATKFCYYNNYNVNQPRHFCRACHRYWTAGGCLRNVRVGSGRRKGKQLTAETPPPAAAGAVTSDAGMSGEPQSLKMQPLWQQRQQQKPPQQAQQPPPQQVQQQQQKQQQQRSKRMRRSFSDGEFRLSPARPTKDSVGFDPTAAPKSQGKIGSDGDCYGGNDRRSGYSSGYHSGGSYNSSLDNSVIVTGRSTSPTLDRESPSVGPATNRPLEVPKTPAFNLQEEDGPLRMCTHKLELVEERGGACMEDCGAPPLSSTFLLPPSHVSILLASASASPSLTPSALTAVTPSSSAGLIPASEAPASASASRPAAEAPPIPPLSLSPISASAFSTAAADVSEPSAFTQPSVHSLVASKSLPWLAAAPLTSLVPIITALNAKPIDEVHPNLIFSNLTPPNLEHLSDALLDVASFATGRGATIQPKNFSHLLAPILALTPPQAAAMLARLMYMQSNLGVTAGLHSSDVTAMGAADREPHPVCDQKLEFGASLRLGQKKQETRVKQAAAQQKDSAIPGEAVEEGEVEEREKVPTENWRVREQQRRSRGLYEHLLTVDLEQRIQAREASLRRFAGEASGVAGVANTVAANEIGEQSNIYLPRNNSALRTAGTGTVTPAVQYTDATPLGVLDSRPKLGFKGISGKRQLVAGVNRAYSGTQFDPWIPDSAVCVGRLYIVQIVNYAIGIYNKRGKIVRLPQPLNEFFGVMPANSTRPGDFINKATCVFDASSGRFFLAAAWLSGGYRNKWDRFGQTRRNADGSTSGYGIVVAASSFLTPMMAWNVFFIPSSNDGVKSHNDTAPPLRYPGRVYWGATPRITVDRYGVYLTTRQYAMQGKLGRFVGSNIYKFNNPSWPNPSFPAHPAKTFIPSHQNCALNLLSLLPPPPTSALPHPSSPAPHPTPPPSAIHKPKLYLRSSKRVVRFAIPMINYNSFPVFGLEPQSPRVPRLSRYRGQDTVFFGCIDISFTFPLPHTSLALWSLSDTSSLMLPHPTLRLRYSIINTPAYYDSDYAKQKAGPAPYDTPQDVVPPTSMSVAWFKGHVWMAFPSGYSLDPTSVPSVALVKLQPFLRGKRSFPTLVKKFGIYGVPGQSLLSPVIGFNSKGRGILAATLIGSEYFPTAAYVRINQKGVIVSQSLCSPALPFPSPVHPLRFFPNLLTSQHTLPSSLSRYSPPVHQPPVLTLNPSFLNHHGSFRSRDPFSLDFVMEAGQQAAEGDYPGHIASTRPQHISRNP